VEENVENLTAFYRLLRDINPELQLVVTVSPVPLLATFRDMDCEVANTVSKATLRVAVDRFCQVHPEVVYFPSYELVTRMGRDAYLEDGVHVKPEVVSRIMSAFMEHFGDAEPAKETETKLVDDQADFVPAPNAKRVGIDSSSWHALRVPIASLAVVYRREVWRRAEAIAGESPIALYGGGRHTRAMIEQVPEIAARPGTIILDDKVSETEIMGVPVRTPDDVDPEAYGAVVVSSDSIQALLRERASIWLGAASTDTRIVGMYEGVDGQILPTADQVVWVSGEEAEADQR
ncbi:MAG: GSCFA domain-containing protein, partial [Planctomycetota bacterium]